ncbi:protein containing PAS domain S-box [Bacteroidales bacterium 6E]|nr:protein containing PAS domain S-box [Bacteroidales bacterium 6E]
MAAGLVIALAALVYKQLFRTDLANPVADIISILAFVGAFLSVRQGKSDLSINIVFFIPLISYFSYLADFSNSNPPAETLFTAMWWFIAGVSFLALFSAVNFRFILFMASGLVYMVFHIIEADLSDRFFALSQNFSNNPLTGLIIVFIAATLIRVSFDKRFSALREEQLSIQRQINETFQTVKQPLVQINAARDHAGNITLLQIEKINHAFESQFKMPFQEAKNQELNYLFGLIFKNSFNWNDLFILNPRQQSEIYSPYHDKWFNLHIFWFNQFSCVCIFYDVSQEKKEIKALKETKDRYMALIEAIPDIFFVIDREGTYEDLVFKGQSDLRLEAGEIIGSTIFDVGFPENMSRKIFECIHRAIDNDSIETIEYSLEANNTTLLFEMRLARLNDNAVISIARDITRRKKAEFELEKAKIRAEEAVALKSRFLANLSHDIRTPMNIIIGLTKLLAEPGLSDFEKEDFIHEISVHGYQLLSMIDNTIYLSKIETNTLEISTSFCNINQLLRDLFNQFYPLMPDNRDLQLKMSAAIQADEVGFETDQVLLKQTLHLLLENAIKFTNEGMIRFGYNNKGSSSVEFFVEDTGPGIPESERENIFLRFYVIDKDRTSQKAGAGIGLSVAQHFVALMGGTLNLNSEINKGSRFWFELPLVNPKGFMRILS